MTDTALLIGWGEVVPGREHLAYKLFAETVELFERLKADKEIVDFETAILAPFGLELDGFMLVRAEPEKLMLLQEREEIHRLQMRAELVHGKFFVVPILLGKRAIHELELFAELAKEIEHEPVMV